MEGKNTTCPLCELVCKTSRGLSRHYSCCIKKQENKAKYPDNFTCDICDMQCMNARGLASHRRIHRRGIRENPHRVSPSHDDPGHGGVDDDMSDVGLENNEADGDVEDNGGDEYDENDGGIAADEWDAPLREGFDGAAADEEDEREDDCDNAPLWAEVPSSIPYDETETLLYFNDNKRHAQWLKEVKKQERNQENGVRRAKDPTPVLAQWFAKARSRITRDLFSELLVFMRETSYNWQMLPPSSYHFKKISKGKRFSQRSTRRAYRVKLRELTSRIDMTDLEPLRKTDDIRSFHDMKHVHAMDAVVDLIVRNPTDPKYFHCAPVAFDAQGARYFEGLRELRFNEHGKRCLGQASSGDAFKEACNSLPNDAPSGSIVVCIAAYHDGTQVSPRRSVHPATLYLLNHVEEVQHAQSGTQFLGHIPVVNWKKTHSPTVKEKLAKVRVTQTSLTELLESLLYAARWGVEVPINGIVRRCYPRLCLRVLDMMEARADTGILSGCIICFRTGKEVLGQLEDTTASENSEEDEEKCQIGDSTSDSDSSDAAPTSAEDAQREAMEGEVKDGARNERVGVLLESEYEDVIDSEMEAPPLGTYVSAGAPRTRVGMRAYYERARARCVRPNITRCDRLMRQMYGFSPRHALHVLDPRFDTLFLKNDPYESYGFDELHTICLGSCKDLWRCLCEEWSGVHRSTNSNMVRNRVAAKVTYAAISKTVMSFIDNVLKTIPPYSEAGRYMATFPNGWFDLKRYEGRHYVAMMAALPHIIGASDSVLFAGERRIEVLK